MDAIIDKKTNRTESITYEPMAEVIALENPSSKTDYWGVIVAGSRRS
jgi:hypothetical protein